MSNVVSVVTFMCVSMHVCVCGGGGLMALGLQSEGNKA